MGETISAISLLELNRSIRSLIDGAQIECWVVFGGKENDKRICIKKICSC